MTLNNREVNGEVNGTQDPLSKTSAYDLSINNLQDLVSFVDTPAGLCVVSKISAPAGAHFSYITSHAPQPSPTWKTIQTSATTHTDPRSALLYMNHSCEPSLEVNVFSPDANGKYPKQPPTGSRNGEVLNISELGLAGEVTVSGSRGIEPGDALTFFYPSTEWNFDRAFDCLCGAPKDVCLGQVKGASAIERQKLDKWFFNDHILKLAAKRDGLA
ncbi:hypothetical protein CLAFUW4_04419 [Fulvia fulva]|uniref:SET domain-containing protein n=1 Tax=Passalora fulva TaxID=5499 RepID=A0A9Q8LG04_PASFU|nr:uncharacterized protein CLAFUR5_04382 [Fulvia fulva]KAK4627171.1 hypothetical protein CLAFUR4_04405 [Fulvia fulva]KAK4628437.1 hypothetical protein CLAFUR0_04407 [Fulvia fulva]UJO16509.1 hypothetical protein CLAFUR5_04382 [Fulvia fulva]WPV14202.1 hypothetical protein CLAFUW4_04419 [Fulvia fulva]WPV28071.1 hypothetical protein CLAFUW7_04409 [Fulvia fulva]